MWPGLTRRHHASPSSAGSSCTHQAAQQVVQSPFPFFGSRLCGQRGAPARHGRAWRMGRLHAAPPLQQHKEANAYRLLQVERGSSREEVRAAYIRQIKLLHPDVNQDMDTTEAAAALNAAYEQILVALESGGSLGGGVSEEDKFDVFDCPEAPPTELFVNPFAMYNVSPLLWEQLQEVAASEPEDPEAALSRAGASFDPGSAATYLSPEQLLLITQELKRMAAAADTISIEVAAFFVRDCLLRARVANNRWGSAW